MIEYGEWLPDLPDLNNPGCTKAENVISHAMSYKSFPTAAVYSSALTNKCLGAIIGRDFNGSVYHYAADQTKLYSLGSAITWTDVSRASGYSLLTDERWSFAQFKNIMVATNYYDDMQQLTVGGTTFADITDIRAKYVAVVGEFLVAAHIYDTSVGPAGNTVRWSAIGNGLSWPTPGGALALTTQAGEQALASGGNIKAIAGGEYGIILQEDAIWRMNYEGPPTFFGFYVIEQGRGTIAPYSVASWGPRVFYLSHDGFYMFDGQSSQPIGANKVDKTLFAEIDAAYYNNISVAIDPRERLVMWAIPVTGHTGGVPNKIYCYNWKTNRWSFITDTVDILVATGSPATTLEDLDALFTAIEDVTPSMDSGRWRGGDPRLSAFKTDKRMYNYNGTAMAATMESKELELTRGHRTNVNRIASLVDGGTTTVNVGTRLIQSGTTSWGSPISLTSEGEAPVRVNSKFFKFRTITTGAFNDIKGVDIVESHPAGRR